MKTLITAGRKLLPAVIACSADLYTKAKIRDEAYEKHPITCCDGKITITRWFNHGAMLGAFKNHLMLLKTMMLSGITALIYMLFFKNYSPLTDLGLSLAIGGAAGNTYERIRYEKVTDFIRFNIGPKRLRHINYNIGDFAVFAGVILMCLGEITNKK